jgi:hypothetical protein
MRKRVLSAACTTVELLFTESSHANVGALSADRAKFLCPCQLCHPTIGSVGEKHPIDTRNCFFYAVGASAVRLRVSAH